MIQVMKYWKQILILISVGISFFAGLYINKPQPCPEPPKQIKEKKIDKTVKNANIKSRTTKKPDGTVVVEKEVIKTETKQEFVETKIETEKKKNKLGVGVKVDPLNLNEQDYIINYSRRITENLWLDSGVEVKSKTITLGASYEF